MYIYIIFYLNSKETTNYKGYYKIFMYYYYVNLDVTYILEEVNVKYAWNVNKS